MEYNNETLAELVIKHDPAAEKWVFNRHCSFCGKFLYPEEITKCKKCKKSVKESLKRPIPFLTSASAVEKLIVWVRNNQFTELRDQIADIINKWMNSTRTADTYRLEIIIACVNVLQDRDKE